MNLIPLTTFAGIVQPRPYGPTGLTTATWLSDTPVHDVTLSELYLPQKGVRIRGLLHVGTYRPPFAVHYDGCLYLEDGHHRVVRYALTHPDSPTMPMHVYRMEH